MAPNFSLSPHQVFAYYRKAGGQDNKLNVPWNCQAASDFTVLSMSDRRDA